MKIIFSLNENEKVFLTHIIFDYWLNGKIKSGDKIFLPEVLNVYNSKDISKVFLLCSRINENKKIEKVFNFFEELSFNDKLDFMICLFNEINSLKIVPTYITNNLNFKDLSNNIKKYKSYL